MSEFSSTVSLDIEIPDSELRNARQQIESEVGSTEIGMTDGGTMSAQAAGGSGGGREQRRRRQEFRWARDNHSHLEEIVEILHGFEDGDDGGGGLFGDVLGGVGGLGGALGSAVGAGLGSMVGSAIGDQIASEEVDVNVDDPSPLDVEDVDDLPVDHPSEPYDIDHPEDPYAIDHPEEPYALDHPDEPYALDHPEDPYDVDHPEEPYAVEDVDDLTVDDPSPLEVEAVDPIEINVTTHAASGDSGETGGPDGFVEGLERDVPGGPTFVGAMRDLGVRDGDPSMPDMNEMGGSPTVDATADLDDLPQSSSSPTTQSQQTTRVTADPQPAEITAEVRQVNVEVRELDRMVDEVVSTFEDEIEDVRQDLQRQIDDIKSQITE